MAYIQWSAFDPIFFLHHAMVDRVLAIWQALHPDAWVVPSRALVKSYTTREGQIQSGSTPLTPFFSNANGSFWTSDGVRDHTRFGYTYPELVGGTTSSGGTNAKAVSRAAAQTVNRLYGSFSPASLFLKEMRGQGISKTHSSGGNRRSRTASAKAGEAERTDEILGLSPRASSSIEGKIFKGDHYHEWIANVRFGKQALDGTFAVHFFLGSPPADPLAWTAAPNHVGTMGVFAADATPSGRGKKQEQQQQQQKTSPNHHDVPISGTVPLTAALVKKVAAGELASLAPEDVEPYLRANLQKRVLGPGGEVWEGSGEDAQECVLGMGIQIVDTEVRAPYHEEELPLWGEGRLSFEMC
jgi:tyrosinase